LELKLIKVTKLQFKQFKDTFLCSEKQMDAILMRSQQAHVKNTLENYTGEFLHEQEIF